MECVSGVEKWQCANPSCEVLGPLTPCVDIEKALVKIGEVANYWEHYTVAPCGLLDCVVHGQWHATMSGDVKTDRSPRIHIFEQDLRLCGI
jgi:hypothetical protein